MEDITVDGKKREGYFSGYAYLVSGEVRPLLELHSFPRGINTAGSFTRPRTSCHKKSASGAP